MSESLPMPTRGPVVVDRYATVQEAIEESGGWEWCVGCDPFQGQPVGEVWLRLESGGNTGLPGNIEVSAIDADLIAAAFNAAEDARVMGYDPIAAVQALPRLLAYIIDDECCCCPQVPICAKCEALSAARTRSQP